jgi:hypothetical protein
MATVSLASSKPPITLTSGRGITITIDRSVNTSNGGSGTVTSVTATAPVVITGTPTTVPNVTLSGINATQTTAGIFSPARLATGTADLTTFLRGDSTWSSDMPVQINVKNTSGGALTKGAPVYATGTVGATSVIEIAAADASASAKMPAIGLLYQDLAVNATGLVMVMGTLTGINTNGYTINSGVFVAPGGGLTNTRPTASTDLVQNVARVTRVSATTGEVLVLGPGRTNDVPNLIATNYLASSGTASATTFLRGDQSWSAAVTSVSGSAPIASSGGATPAISIAAATTSAAGSMSSTDKTKLDALSADVAPAFIAPSSVKAYGVPGLRPTGQGTALQSMDRLWYEPWFLETSATLDRLAVEVVTTAGSAGKVLRMGIYNANTSWIPTTLVVDAGTVAVDALGIQAATVNVTLPAGRYMCAWVLPTTGTAPTLRQIAGTVNYYPNISGIAGNPYQVSQYLAGQGGLASSGLPSTATAPDVYGAAGTVASANFHVRARWA